MADPVAKMEEGQLGHSQVAKEYGNNAMGDKIEGGEGGYSHAPDDLSYGVDMKHIRWCGILQRIALLYFVVALIETLTTKLRPTVLQPGHFSIFTAYKWQCLGGFIVFLIYMITVKCGMRGHFGPACNAVGYVDRAVWGVNHLYKSPVWQRLKACTLSSPTSGPFLPNAPSWCLCPFEPEGLLSSISAILSCTIGIHHGHALIHFKVHFERLKQWVSMGFGLLIIAIILHFTDAIPLNKQLYSFSYVCFTAGAAGIVFSGFYILIDVWGFRMPFLFLEWIGMNATLIFVLGAQGILPAFVNGRYYESPNNTLIMILVDHAVVVYPVLDDAPWEDSMFADFVMPFFHLLLALQLPLLSRDSEDKVQTNFARSWTFTFSIFTAYQWQLVESNIKLAVKCGMRGHFGSACNAVGYVDRQVWGINYLYHNPVWKHLHARTLSSPCSGLLREDAPSWCHASFDPEGLLSSISAILSNTIGIHYGITITGCNSMGFCLLVLAFILHFTHAIPINKRLYTISYVCLTAGAAATIFSGLLHVEWIGMKFHADICAGGTRYYEHTDKTLVTWIKDHAFIDASNTEKVGILLYVLSAEITFFSVLAGILHRLGIYRRL
ncbi:hypothetical protein SLEP1_g53291 [Rubroshorea leprosula]|uniref:Heparan-alpha-glucosaminide N-acetyltransferase n=1 Tax=Rubroshorea leprosula TaxID=152421 RepID=A0AAV5M8Z0_9ROSI|nr:hypothetical protein SLEP1_g53291 [Rubroshorea leprosula]